MFPLVELLNGVNLPGSEIPGGSEEQMRGAGIRGVDRKWTFASAEVMELGFLTEQAGGQIGITTLVQ